MSHEVVIEPKPFSPIKQRKQFLDWRLTGIGGSDIGAIIAHETEEDAYSCKRAVYASKLPNVGHEQESNHHIERGIFLETPVAKLYSEKTGRETRPVGGAYLRDKSYIRCNADRLQRDPKKTGTGVLEIKCPSSWTFRKYKKEGLPNKYIVQLQYEMLCYGASWGSFAIYSSETHELEVIDVERDNELINSLLSRASFAYGIVDGLKTMPANKLLPKLAEYCRDTKSCISCSRIGLIETLAPKAGEAVIDQDEEAHLAHYLEINKQLKELEEEKENARASVLNLLGTNKSIMGQNFKATMSVTERESASVKNIRAFCDKELQEKLINKSSSETLRVTEVKKNG